MNTNQLSQDLAKEIASRVDNLGTYFGVDPDSVEVTLEPTSWGVTDVSVTARGAMSDDTKDFDTWFEQYSEDEREVFDLDGEGYTEADFLRHAERVYDEFVENQFGQAHAEFGYAVDLVLRLAEGDLELIDISLMWK